MSTHADVIRAKRDAVVEAAKEFVSDRDADSDLVALEQAVDALIAAEQAVCVECGAAGRRWDRDRLHRDDDGDPVWSDEEGDYMRGGWVPCPACHGTGRNPDTFRDDGATTPEGCEDERQGEVPGA